jgi:HNH endonuclease
MLTLERLKQVLHYDPETGRWTWLERISVRIQAGKEANYINPDGYHEIGIDGENYLGHRLAWFYMTGEWPIKQIDHRDLCKSNNRWNNLREAEHGQNVTNTNARKNSKTGIKGVFFIPKIKKYHSRIMHNHKLYLLGYFETKEEAAIFYKIAAARLHGEFARCSL